MPKWDIDLSDGRTITVESDQEPTEDEVLSAVGEFEGRAEAPDDIGSQFLYPPPDQPWLRAEPTDMPGLPPEEGSSWWRRGIADPALKLAQGIVGLPQAAVGLADIPTLGLVGKAVAGETDIPLSGLAIAERMLRSAGADVNLTPKFRQTKEFIGEGASPESKAAMEKFSAAEGIIPKVQAAIQNPSVIAGTVAESIPSTFGGAAAGRVALSALGKAAPYIGAAIGEGAVSGGQMAEDVRSQTESGYLTPKQAGLSAASGALTGLLGAVGGRVAQKLGLADIDTLLTKGLKRGVVQEVAKKNMPLVKEAIGSMVSEGFLEELPQSLQEQVAQNLAVGKPWDEGMTDAGVLGTFAGIAMGGGATVTQRALAQPTTERTPDAIQPESAPIPGPVQQPEVAQESAEQVPAAEGSPKAAEALTNVDDALRARGYRDFHIQKMSESEKQAEAAKPLPTPEADAIRYWQTEDAIKAETDINKRMAMLQNVFMERELIKNRNPKNPGGVPERPTEGGVPSDQETQRQEEVLTEPAGMGAATPAEFQPPKPFVTSNKNRIVDEERKARGLPPMMDLARQGNQAAWDSAMRQIDEDPQIQDELITELTTQPRALTATENSLLLHRRIDLRNEYEKALLRWRDAFQGDDMVRAAEESGRVREWSSKLSDLENITKATGAESGRSLQARKMMANEDFSLAAMELRAMEAKGRELTGEEHVQLIRAQERILELENRLAELEGARETKEVDTATTETMKEVSRDAPKESKSKDFDLDREETLLSGIKAKVDKGQLNDITSLVQQLARVFWRRGIRGREPMIDALHETLKTILPDFTRDDTQRAFSGYGNFKPLSKEEIDVGLRDLRGQTQQVLKMEALEARKPLEKTGQERRVPSDEERRLIKQVNELKRKYGVVVTDPATQLKSALAARKTYYEHRIADLKHEIETRQRIVKSKTASPTDPELDVLIAEHERLKAEHEQIFTKPGISDEQRLKQAIAAAQRNLAHWEVRLDNAEKGKFDKRTPGRKVTSAELELIQAEAAAIREHVKELKDLQNPKKTKEEIALQSLKTRMKTRVADLKRRIATNDFTKKERKPVKLDAEATKLKAEVETLKSEFDSKLEKDRWDRSSLFEKTKARTWGVYDLIKTLMATGEFSFILRQGKGSFLEALISPKRAANFGRALRSGLIAMRSSQKQREVEQEIFSDPMYPLMLQSKLYVPEHGSRLSKQEEFAMGRYADAIPGINAFNRAAETFLKKIRFDSFKTMARSITKTGEPTLDEAKVIARFINEQTGRGGLGAAEPAHVLLNRIFFSPRYLMSRLQMASGHAIWAGDWKGTGRARAAVAQSYARMLVGAALYYSMLMMFFNRDRDDDEQVTIEPDPRSSDVGKLKIGDTRLDPLAGISQVAAIGARTVTGESKSLKGDIFPIVGDKVPYGRDDWFGYAARFARSKLHPTIGGAIDLRVQKNMVGEPVTLTSKLTESGPMTWYDIYEALRVNDIDDGTALALLALLGEGIQTYEKKK